MNFEYQNYQKQWILLFSADDFCLAHGESPRCQGAKVTASLAARLSSANS